MADNVEAAAGSGGPVFATDDATGVHHPYVKLEFGADNTQTKVSSADPLPVNGGVADDAAAAGNPVRIGAVAKDCDGTDPGSVDAENDLAGLITDRNRRLLVSEVHPNCWSANESHSSAQTNNALKGAPGANLSLYITDIIISNNATDGTIKLVEDTGGTPVDRLGPLFFKAGAGMSKRLGTPLRITANKDIGFTSVSMTTHVIFLSGYIAP